MNRPWALTALHGLLLLSFAACGQPPTQEPEPDWCAIPGHPLCPPTPTPPPPADPSASEENFEWVLLHGGKGAGWVYELYGILDTFDVTELYLAIRANCSSWTLNYDSASERINCSGWFPSLPPTEGWQTDDPSLLLDFIKTEVNDSGKLNPMYEKDGQPWKEAWCVAYDALSMNGRETRVAAMASDGASWGVKGTTPFLSDCSLFKKMYSMRGK